MKTFIYLVFISTIILSFSSCESEKLENFPLLGKWNVLEVSNKCNLTQQLDSLNFTMEFTETGNAYYEQGRIKDTLNYSYNFDTKKIWISKLSELIENEIGYIQVLVLINSSQNTALCKYDLHSSCLIEWIMDK